jgi:hypothetical protein
MQHFEPREITVHVGAEAMGAFTHAPLQLRKGLCGQLVLSAKATHSLQCCAAALLAVVH